MNQNNQYHICLARDEQLNCQFLDLLTKYFLNTNQYLFFNHFGLINLYLSYGQVYKFLKSYPQDDKSSNMSISSNKISNKLSLSKQKFNNSFSFQSCNSSMTLLLDLSPYMLNFDYQSRSTPLANLQIVLKDILLKLKEKKQNLIKIYQKMQTQHKQYNWNVQFNLTIYLFSIYEQAPQVIFYLLKNNLKILLYRQDINYTSFTSLNDFIINAIQKSNLPYEKKNNKKTIGDMIQKILDTQQPLLGIRSIIVISSFNEKQPNNKIFFTSNWYNYSFVNVATNMGSHLIQQKQIYERFGASSFYHIKYFFSCQFIENWQKVDRIKKDPQNYSFVTTKTQRHKTIIYMSEGKPVDNLINKIMKIRLDLKINNKTNSINGIGKGQNTSLKLFDIPKKQYRISELNFNYILRTRYQQGWIPIYHYKNSHNKTSKCIFKLDYNPYISLIYKAQLFSSHQGQFYSIQIGSKLNNQSNFKKYKSNVQNVQIKQNSKIFDLIENIDIISTSQYKSLKTNLMEQVNIKRKNFLNPLNKNYQFQSKALRYVLSNPDQWGKFSRIKYLYFNFIPILNKSLLEQFLNQICFFLGQRISQSIFMKKGSQKSENNELKQHKLQFSQLIRKHNMIKIKLAYINYTFRQIKIILQQFILKFQNKKFKTGQAILISDQLFKFSYINQLRYDNLFQNKWKLKIKDSQTYKSFYFYFYTLMKYQGFQQTGQIRQNPEIRTYGKRIYINQAKQQSRGNIEQKSNQTLSCLIVQKMIQKIIYLIIEQIPNNQLVFTFLMFPIIGKLKVIEEQAYYTTKIDNLKSSSTNSFIQNKKQISVLDFFYRFTQSIKFSQFKIMKIIYSYNQIHQSLLLKVKQNYFSKKLNLGFSNNLKQLLKQLYYFRNNSFEQDYLLLCQEIQKKYYNKENQKIKKVKNQNQIDIDLIPQPQKYFIQADVQEVKGDLTIKKGEKQYIFFLFSPYHPIYICRRKNKFYYKNINLMFEDINIQQASIDSIQVMVKQISLIIQRQEYKKLYTNIFNSKQILQNEQNARNLFKKIENFNPPKLKSIQISDTLRIICLQLKNQDPQKKIQQNLKIRIEERMNQLLKKFVNIYFEILNLFFDKKIGNYLFQRKQESQISDFIIKYKLQPEKMSSFNQLILVNYLRKGNQNIYFNETNFQNLILSFFSDFSLSKPQINFVCYNQLHDQNLQIKQNFTYLIQCIKQVCSQLQKQLQRIKIIHNSEINQFLKINAQSYFNKSRLVPHSEIYEKISFQKLSKYIQSPLMQKYLPLRKIPNQVYKYTVIKEIKQSRKQNKEHQQTIFIPFYLLLEIKDDSIEIKYVQYQYFHKIESIKEKVQIYIQELINFINCSILINQMNDSRQLPIEPRQLFISNIVNSPNNKLIETKKKAGPKKNLKGIRGRMQNQKPENIKKNVGQNQTIKRNNPIPILLKSFISLNERFRPGEGLQAIKTNQSFQVLEIMNLKNTYIFPNFINKQNIIFHFEQEQFQKIPLNQFFQNELIDLMNKPKRVLLYYAYGLNTLISKSQIDKIFREIIKAALSQKVFQSLSRELYIAPQIIHPNQERELKLGDKKSFSFDLPFIPFVDDFKGYLKQHILMYHTKTDFKSEKNKIRLINSIQYDTKLQRSQTFSSSFNKSFLKSQNQQKKTLRQSFLSSLQKKDIQKSQLLQFCQRCIPTMWLFNFRKNMKLQTKFGKCVYLLKIQINHNVSTSQDVKIWQKTISNKKKKYYIGAYLQDDQKNIIIQYLNGHKLFSSQKDTESQIFKTTVTFNIIHYLGQPIFKAMQQVFNSIIRSTMSDYYIEKCLNFYNLKESNRQITLEKKKNYEIYLKKEKQSQKESKLTDKLFQTFPSKLNLNKAQSQMVFQTNNQFDVSQFLVQQSMNDLIINESQLIDNQKQIQNKFDHYYDKILHQSQSIDKVIQLSSNQSLFKIKCNQDVIVKDIKIYFKDFYYYLINLLDKILGTNLPIIFYAKFNDQKNYCYWVLQSYKKQQDKEQKYQKVQKQHLQFSFITKFDKIIQKSKKKFQKIGFILNPQFYNQIQNVKRKKIQKSSFFNSKIYENNQMQKNQQILNLQQLQRGKIFLQEKSFCLTDFYFARSIYIHYQISYEGFKYYSYNINIFLNNKISEFLIPLQIWLQQKYRLLKFIKGNLLILLNILGLKQHQIYDISQTNHNKKIQNKFGFIFQLYLQTLKNNKKQQDQKRIKLQQIKSIPLSKILIGLVFNDYPFKYQDKSLMNLQNQIQEVFQVLKITPIQYKGMPQYKGKQTFLLQKLGRQYISLLRYQHGWKPVENNNNVNINIKKSQNNHLIKLQQNKQIQI